MHPAPGRAEKFGHHASPSSCSGSHIAAADNSARSAALHPNLLPQGEGTFLWHRHLADLPSAGSRCHVPLFLRERAGVKVTGVNHISSRGLRARDRVIALADNGAQSAALIPTFSHREKGLSCGIGWKPMPRPLSLRERAGVRVTPLPPRRTSSSERANQTRNVAANLTRRSDEEFTIAAAEGAKA